MSMTLNAELREDMGKGASRRLRHANKVPAILYGSGKDPVCLSLLQKDIQKALEDETFFTQIIKLSIDGNEEDVLLKDLQHHPYRIDVNHLDFARVDMKKKVHVHVPLHFINEETAPGVKQEGGAVSHVMVEVEVICLPNVIPAFIEVDIGEMNMGDILHLSDLKLPEGVEIAALTHGDEHEHDTAVVNIHARKTAAADEDEGAEAAEGGESEADGGEES